MEKKVVLGIAWGMLCCWVAACSSFEQEPLPTLVPAIQLPVPTEAPDSVPGPEPTLAVDSASTEDTPSEDILTEDTPTEDTPTEDTVADNAPAGPFANHGAFAYINNAGEGLFLVRPDNSAQTQYYDLQNVDKLLSASFNGERIGFVREGLLYIARTDGSGVLEITAVSNPSWILWSPVRDEFALIDNGDLLVLQASSGAANRVVTGMQLPNVPGSVTWSPDGNELLFTCGSQSTDLCRVVSDGNSPFINITNNGADSFTWYREPAWSPDGGQISYISPDENKNLQLFVMNPDGSDVRQITEGEGQNSLHNWSPNGEYIAYANFADGRWQALATKADGSQTVALSETESMMDAVIPVWDTIGEQVSLLYTTSASFDSISIALFCLEDMALTPVTDNGWQLQWSQDGQQLAYIAENGQIYVQLAETKGAPFVISCPSGCKSFVWLP